MVFGKPFPLHRDLRVGPIDFAEVIGRKFDVNRPQGLLQTLQLPGTRYRDDPWLLGEQPGERDLSGCRFLTSCDVAEQINHCLIFFPGLLSKARARGGSSLLLLPKGRSA